MYEGCHSDVLVCLSSPPPLNCRQRTLGRLPEVWGRWNRGVNLNLGPITLLSDFPHEVGHILSLVVYLFVCLRLCRLPFHWVHLFLSCSHVTGSLLNSLSISFWGARAHNYYVVLHIHVLFCLPKMTNRRCARTSPPPMRNKDQRLHFEWLSNTELLQLVFMSCLNNWSQP